MMITSGAIKYRLGGRQHIATWEVTGRTVTVTAPVGSFRIALGLDDPEKLARRLLKTVCARQERHGALPVRTSRQAAVAVAAP